MTTLPVFAQNNSNQLLPLDNTIAGNQTAVIVVLEKEAVQRNKEIEKLRKMLQIFQEKMKQLAFSVARLHAIPVSHSAEIGRSQSNSPRLWRGG